MSDAERTGKWEHDRPPRLFTIPSGASFLDTLAQAVLAGDLPEPGGRAPGVLELPSWTLLLPTRRAARALREAFLRASGRDAILLPAIRPIGDVDEEAALLAEPDIAFGERTALELPDAINAVERRLALARLIQEWSALNAPNVPGEPAASATPAQAFSLAGELAALMDTLDSEQVDPARIVSLVPDEFADHWQPTTEFLKIVNEHWPRYLQERGLMDPYARRDALMRAETARLQRDPPQAPVIAAGSTATVPATAELLETVSRLESGAVVLPGLDLGLDQESWDAISQPEPHPEHPQFGLQQFLARLGVGREHVRTLGSVGERADRVRLVSEAMRPAGTTERWSAFAENTDPDAARRALHGVARLDAPTVQDEAEAIALLLRHATETPGKTAALVTPDRTLARRVAARLEKWRLRVDDSAGVPLAKTSPGSFMEAIAEAVGRRLAPVPLLALLKHPLTLLRRTPAEMRRVARLLEVAAFRRPAVGRGLAAHRAAVALARSEPSGEGSGRLPSDRDWGKVEALLDDLEAALDPLVSLFQHSSRGLTPQSLARAHVLAAEALAADSQGLPARLWRGEAGEALASLFESLIAADPEGLTLAADEYPELYRSFAAGIAVRPRVPSHPRIHIWGPLEARLQRPDMVILGGLNEGVWPASVETGPWLNRPMLETLGLPAPERRIGLSAHDVAQLLGAGEVWLTRAQKSEGAPTVASRWLLRLDAVLSALGLEDSLQPEAPWLSWAHARDAADPVSPSPPPAPMPPVDARPQRLSVTRIESWIANPYEIFARDILRLYKLGNLDGEPDAALRGLLIHDALGRFAERYPDRLPRDIAAALMRHADELFRRFGDHARIAAFWRGQFAVFARWFAQTEPRRREGVTRVYAEQRGSMDLSGASPFTLSARADRIDVRSDGTLAIYDYKTGAPPSSNKVADGFAPQLPLTALIAAAGGFEEVAAARVARIAYIRARGYREGGEERDAATQTPEALAAEARDRLECLIAAYSRPEQGYAAQRRRGFNYDYDDYAHLARVGEWLSEGDGEE